MKSDRTWHGVRLRTVAVGADPDAVRRTVRIPATWDDAAAAALCAMIPGSVPLALPALADRWVQPLAARAHAAGMDGLPARLHTLLLQRRGAPSESIWRGERTAPACFVLNLPGFHDPEAGFDVAGFAAAVDTAGQALRLLAPGPWAITMADLAGLLAALGLDYASQPARDVAACLAAVLRGRADAASAGGQADLLAGQPAWPVPPACVVPGLAAEAAAARAMAVGSAGPATTAIRPPGPVEALLGCETGGIAPAFAPVAAHGLTRTAAAWLAGRRISMQDALAASLAGEAVFPASSAADHAAMHDTVAAIVHAMPPRPAPAPAPRRETRREELPARRRGYTQKAAIGGHRIFLRTGDYADGRLGEIGIALPRESAAARGLAEALATAVSLGLQHGVPLDCFVDAFAHQRFAPSGVVEGDPAVDHAASVPDYVFRSLAASYLGRLLPADGPTVAPHTKAEAPLLPLDLPRGARRPALRLVAG